jgi:electron transport complex protein RnfB
MPDSPDITRRNLLTHGLRLGAIVAAGGAISALAAKGHVAETVWQIDPFKCIQCGKCATNCVLNPSAVKCQHNAADLCNYCRKCFGYFKPLNKNAFDESAETQMCPVGAIGRKPIEGDYFEYHIDTEKCMGCAKCVKGCMKDGNQSLFLQIDHGKCVNCNRCSIAAECPSQAISRVPLGQPYNIKREQARA